MKNAVASEKKNVRLKINIFILIIYIGQRSTLPFRQALSLNQSTALS